MSGSSSYDTLVAGYHALAESVLDQWPFGDAGLTLVSIRENAVFKVTTTSGSNYALRIHRHGYHSDAALRSELQWMDALAANQIAVPQVIASKDGALSKHSSHPQVQGHRQIDVFEWVPGVSYAAFRDNTEPDVGTVGRVFENVGKLIAALHNHATCWQLPPGFTRHAWDLDGVAGANPLWGRPTDLPQLNDEQRRLITRLEEAVRDDLRAFGQTSENFGLIHADLLPENIMIDNEAVRPIDFDDAGFGWHMFDIATALISVGRHSDAAEGGLVCGYRQVRDLADSELEALPLFFAARRLTYLGWAHTRAETQTAQNSSGLIDTTCSSAESYLSQSKRRPS